MYTSAKIRDMSQAEAITEIENAIYEAAKLLEPLANKGKIRGNGHHARQEAQRAVSAIIKERWKTNMVHCPACWEKFNEEDGLVGTNGESLCSDDCLSEYESS